MLVQLIAPLANRIRGGMALNLEYYGGNTMLLQTKEMGEETREFITCVPQYWDLLLREVAETRVPGVEIVSTPS